MPSTDQEAFLKSTEHIGCFDSVTFGHCPGTILAGTILGAAVMENYGRVFGGNDKSDFSIYSHVYTESVSAVQCSV